MSLRNRNPKKQLSNADADALRALNIKRDQLIMKGLSPEHAKRMMAAEETVFAVKSTDVARQGDRVSDNFKKISDLDASQGVVIHNPITGRNEAILGKDNLHNMDGTLHPATVRYLKRHS